MIVEGLEDVLTRLHKKLKHYPYMTKKGLISAGLYIQRESQKKGVCPRDLGNLANSAFTVWAGEPRGGGASRKPRFKGSDSQEVADDYQKAVEKHKMLMAAIPSPAVTVGFGASYAVFVHENMEARHKKGHAKFLQYTVSQNHDMIFALIKREAVKVK